MSEKGKKSGGPAFPLTIQWPSGKLDVPYSEYGHLAGMHLRDAFAMQAPVDFEMALKVFGTDATNLSKDSDRAAFFAVWALLRYEYADAMLSERDKP